MTNVPDRVYDEAFREHERFLWQLSYRLTGSAADADDIVQETFVRAMEHPPHTGTSWRPWLVRVAVNLGRDLLRRRRRRAYRGPWLPSPIETRDPEAPTTQEPLDGPPTTEGRYDLLESVSFAFLLALEALTPQQRAVLLLRDVFDYTVRETAEALDLSEGNVKTTHHRARRVIREYDHNRCLPTRERSERTRAALAAFLGALAGGDVRAVETLLADSVRAVNDGGGDFFAARVPLMGRQRVARFHTKISRWYTDGARFAMRTVNGMPAVIGTLEPQRSGQPPRVVMLCDTDAEGRITRLYSVVARRKLGAIDFD